MGLSGALRFLKCDEIRPARSSAAATAYDRDPHGERGRQHGAQQIERDAHDPHRAIGRHPLDHMRQEAAWGAAVLRIGTPSCAGELGWEEEFFVRDEQGFGFGRHGLRC